MENQQFSPEQLTHLANLRDKRKAKFQSMGTTPTFSHQEMNEAANGSVLAAAGPSARDRLSKIRQIQEGAFKSEMRQFNNAENPETSFQELKVPKRPQSPEQEAQKLEEMKKLGLTGNKPKARGSSQMSAMEAMFDPDSGGGSYNSDVVMGHAYEERKAHARYNQQSQPGQEPSLINEDAMMGGIGSWENAFRSKVGAPQGQQQYAQPQGQPGMLNEQHVPQQAPMGYQQQDPTTIMGPTQISQLIETKVNEIVGQRMREVLSEFSQEFSTNQKPKAAPGQILAEKVKDAKSGKYYKNVVKIDGKYYKLSEVKS